MDYGDDFEKVLPEQMAKLINMVRHLRDKRKELAAAEFQFKKMEKEVAAIEETHLPELMSELGHNRVTVGSFEVTLTEDVKGSVTKADRPEAHEWLEKNGYGGMIKRQVVVAFNREQEVEVIQLLDSLRGKYPGVKQEKEVHHSTMAAWVRKMILEEGEELPPCFSVFHRTFAKVTEE